MIKYPQKKEILEFATLKQINQIGGTEGEIVVAHGCRKRGKLICGTVGEIVVAHVRLPSPALLSYDRTNKQRLQLYIYR